MIWAILLESKVLQHRLPRRESFWKFDLYPENQNNAKRTHALAAVNAGVQVYVNVLGECVSVCVCVRARLCEREGGGGVCLGG